MIYLIIIASLSLYNILHKDEYKYIKIIFLLTLVTASSILVLYYLLPHFKI
jgi:hypothetical protein